MHLIVHTVGHSNQSLPEFLTLLKTYGIEQLCDIRRFPVSKRFPHFSKAPLAAALKDAGIDYTHIEALGGMRESGMNSAENAGLDKGFRAYADYMRSGPFREAAESLLALAEAGNSALMCAEKLPDQCHRRLLSDYLLLKKVSVYHIESRARRRGHQLSSDARVHGGRLTYPPVQPELF